MHFFRSRYIIVSKNNYWRRCSLSIIQNGIFI